MKRAIIESRPYLLLSLLFGISYFFARDSNIPGMYLMFWKGAGVGFLVIYALRQLHRIDGKMLAAIMAFGALGDMAIEMDEALGGAAFLIGHIIAIAFFARFRRHRLGFSQKMLAILLVPLTTFMAWQLTVETGSPELTAIYAFFLAIMVAMAWTSRFSRYHVGTGAMLFLLSDLLIFARMGPLMDSSLPALLIWPLYYFGQFLIATGVVATLRHEMAADSADPA